MLQMQFSQKQKYGLMVYRALRTTVNLAYTRHELPASRFVVHEAFVGKGEYLKRIKIMGRGVIVLVVFVFRFICLGHIEV